jgi:hypothetical protein
MGDHPKVYDKAKYHYDGDYPAGLPVEQAYVHTGMYLGWLIDNDFLSDEMCEEDAAQLLAFKRREITGPQVYSSWDGALVDDMLTDEANDFTEEYFDFQTGKYLDDYDRVLAGKLPSMYHVRDTWENYDKLRAVLDARLAEWKTKRRA